MDWNARSCWIEENEIPDMAKVEHYGIWYVFCDPRSENILDALKAIEGAGRYPGLYFAQSWRPNDAASVFAKWVSDTLNAALPKVGDAESPPCMLDLETTNVVWVQEMLSAYRTHQPKRPTAYTNAPFQGGYVPYASLRMYQMPFFVQLYYGDMSPVDSARAILEASRLYGDARQIHPFYDGAKWDWGQYDGCQYMLDRMP